MLCVNERERTIWQFVIVKNKLMSVSNASVLLLTMNLIVTATLTMLWRNSWSITGQTHEKLLPCAPVSKRVLVQNHSYHLWKWVCFAWKWTYRRNTFPYEWFNTKPRFDTEVEGNLKMVCSLLIQISWFTSVCFLRLLYSPEDSVIFARRKKFICWGEA